MKPGGVLDTEQLERLDGGPGQRIDRAQQRDLVVERLSVHDVNAVRMQSSAPLGFSRMNAGQVESQAV